MYTFTMFVSKIGLTEKKENEAKRRKDGIDVADL